MSTTEPAVATTRVWKPRSFFASPAFLFAIVLTIVSFGLVLPLILLWWLLTLGANHRLWVENGRLFADKNLPPEGVDLAAVRVHLMSVTFLKSVTIERGMTLMFYDAKQRLRAVGINQMSFGRQQFEDALATITQGIAEAKQNPSEDAVKSMAALEQLEERQKITPRRVFRFLAFLAALGAFAFAAVIQLIPIPESQWMVTRTQTKIDELQAEMESTSSPDRKEELAVEVHDEENQLTDYLIQLWVFRGVVIGSILMGLVALLGVWWLKRPQAMAT